MNDRNISSQQSDVLNAFTVDVEDYYQVSAFSDQVTPARWVDFESRVEMNTHRILDILNEHHVRGTFFILGWVAERFPKLVQEIHNCGHELGVHSQWHQLVYDLTPRQFRQDVEASRKAIEDCVSNSVGLYRAPSFSITKRSLWALEELVDAGFWLDSSIFPIRHDRYGIPDANPWPHMRETPSGLIGEFPAAVCNVGGLKLPVSGGGYFRLLPYRVTDNCLNRINHNEGHSFMFYIHPWELDVDQPRIRSSAVSRFRHYQNLHTTETKLERLLKRFSFGTLSDAFDQELSRLGEELDRRGSSRALRQERIQLRSSESASESTNFTWSTPNTGRGRPRILYVTHRLPFPPNRGDRIRTFHILQSLHRHADVFLASFNDEPIDTNHYSKLKTYCTDVRIIEHNKLERMRNLIRAFSSSGTISEALFRSSKMTEVIRDWTSEFRFDGALVSSSALGQYCDHPTFADIPVVVDLIDIDSEKWLEYSRASRFPLNEVYSRESRLLRNVETRLSDSVNSLSVVTELEAELLKSFAPQAPVITAHNGVAFDYFMPRVGRVSQECVFIGALDYKPNVDGICEFVSEVWPHIHAARPDSALKIVGRAPVPAVRDLEQFDGVEVVGTVPDVRPYLVDAAAVIVPLTIARGIQNKVLEALAMERPVVGSPAAIQGIDVIPGVHLLQAETAHEWTEAIVSLLDDRNFATELGRAGGDQVRRFHDWNTCLQPLLTALGIKPIAQAIPTTEHRHVST